ACAVALSDQVGQRQIRRTQSRDQALGELQDQTFERRLGRLRPLRPADVRRAQARASHSRRDGRTGQGRMRSKLPPLKLALDGRMEDHHRQLLSMQLDRLDRLDRDLKQRDAKLEGKLKPYARQLELLDGIPGVNGATAA